MAARHAECRGPGRPAAAPAKEIQPLTPEHARTLLDAASDHRLGGARLGCDRAWLAAGRGAGAALARRGLRGRHIERPSGARTQRGRRRRQTAARGRAAGAPQAHRGCAEAERRTAGAPSNSSRRPRRMARVADALRFDGAEVGPEPSHDPHAADRGHRVEGAPQTTSSRSGSPLATAWQDDGLVFTSPIGTPLDPRNVTREFHAMLHGRRLAARFGFTICGTPRRRCCSRRASIRARSWRRSATRRSA